MSLFKKAPVAPVTVDTIVADIAGKVVALTEHAARQQKAIESGEALIVAVQAANAACATEKAKAEKVAAKLSDLLS